MQKVNRKDLILFLIYANDKQPLSGKTRLQKLLFLLEKEYRLSSFLKAGFGFQPWRFGPFSADLLRDLEFLENVGLVKCRAIGLPVDPERLEQDNLAADYLDFGIEYAPNQYYVQPEFSLTDKGIRFVEERIAPRLPTKVRGAVEQAKRKYGQLSLTSILRYVYSKYPRYAAKSEIQEYL